MPTIHTDMIQPRGAAYRTSQLHRRSHYLEPIDESDGRLAGNSRIWGDATAEVQSRVIDLLIEASRDVGLGTRETAHVLAIARIESGFNPDAAAGTTSASGLGQFIDATGAAFGLDATNRFDADAQARALVAHFIENRDLAARRGQGEAYIYKYHHDGPVRDYGGLGHSEAKVMPLLDRYTSFVEQHVRPDRDTAGPREPARHEAPTPAPRDTAEATSPPRPLQTTTLQSPDRTDTTTPGGIPAAPDVDARQRALRQGSRDSEVSVLQTALVELGIGDRRDTPLTVDGHYGPRTGEAVRAFQQAHGLDVDGIVGPETWRALAQAARSEPARADLPMPDTAPVWPASLDGLLAAARGGDAGAFRVALADFATTPALQGLHGVERASGDAAPAPPELLRQDAAQR